MTEKESNFQHKLSFKNEIQKNIYVKGKGLASAVCGC